MKKRPDWYLNLRTLHETGKFNGGVEAMSARGTRIGLVLLTISAITGCKDEPLTSTSITDLNGGSVSAIQASVTGSPVDRAEIQQIVTTFDQSWTAGDAVTYAGQYAGITDWVGPTGAVVKDPSSLIGLYTFVLTVALPGTIRQSTIRNLTFLSGTRWSLAGSCARSLILYAGIEQA